MGNNNSTNLQISDEYIDIPSALAPSSSSDELISIPLFLSSDEDYGVSLAAVCDQTCLYECQASQSGDCTVACEKSCQSGEGCSSCQDGSCQSTAQTSVCWNDCQSSCQVICEICQSNCEINAQVCTTTCETTCQTICQSSCQSTCQIGCQGSEGCTSCQGSEGCTSCESEQTVQPETEFAVSITATSPTTADFTASFTGGDSENKTMYRYVKLTIDGDGTYIIQSDSIGGADSYFSYEIDELSPNTLYTWNAILGYGKNSSSITWLSTSDSGSFRTDNIIIEKWSWNESNGSATASETKQAYNVLMGTVTCDNFSHKVWNDMVDKVNEFREASGTNWDSNYTGVTVNGCKVVAGETLSAKKYNALKYNVGSLSGTGIKDVVANETKLTGYMIYHIMEAMNEGIDNL